MLKGTILKNLFKLADARCATRGTAEKLVQTLLPNVCMDRGVFLSHVVGLGYIELFIYKECFTPEGKSGLCYRINVKAIYANEDDGE